MRIRDRYGDPGSSTLDSRTVCQQRDRLSVESVEESHCGYSCCISAKNTFLVLLDFSMLAECSHFTSYLVSARLYRSNQGIIKGRQLYACRLRVSPRDGAQDHIIVFHPFSSSCYVESSVLQLPHGSNSCGASVGSAEHMFFGVCPKVLGADIQQYNNSMFVLHAPCCMILGRACPSP